MSAIQSRDAAISNTNNGAALSVAELYPMPAYFRGNSELEWLYQHCTDYLRGCYDDFPATTNNTRILKGYGDRLFAAHYEDSLIEYGRQLAHAEIEAEQHASWLHLNGKCGSAPKCAYCRANTAAAKVTPESNRALADQFASMERQIRAGVDNRTDATKAEVAYPGSFRKAVAS